jgi:hypothetical protein
MFCASLWLKTERPVLDRPLKVGGDIQPRLVTVLTPATTFTVDGNFSQKARRVNSVKQFNCSRPRQNGMDRLVKANRLDLIANILKGYNPSGRMYAALALIAMQRKGIGLPPGLLRALKVVRNMVIQLETCNGCIVTPKTPKLIIADWPF